MTTTTKPVDREALISGALRQIAVLQEQRQRLAPAATRGDAKALDQRTELAIEAGKLSDFVELQREAILVDRLNAEAEERQRTAEKERERKAKVAELWGDSGRKRLFGAWNDWLAAGEQIVADYLAWRAEYNQVSGNTYQALEAGKKMAGRLQIVLGAAFGEPGYFGHNGLGFELLPGPGEDEPAPKTLPQLPDRFVPDRREPHGARVAVRAEDTRPGTVLLVADVPGDRP